MVKLLPIIAAISVTLLSNVLSTMFRQNNLLIGVENRRLATNDTPSEVDTNRIIGSNHTSSTTSKVCYYGNTRFFLDKDSTNVYAMEALLFLRDVALRSFNEAITRRDEHGIPEKVKLMIPISQYEPHFQTSQELIDFLQPVVTTYDRLQVDFSKDAYQTAAASFRAQTDCEWVISVKLDADDVLSPGYLDWIVQSVIPTLDRGAVVASRKLARLNYGFGRCSVDPEKHFDEPMGLLETCPYFNGWSVGQARVLRRDVFLALDMPFDSDAHAVNLSVLRSAVLTKILKRAPPPLLKRDFKLAKNFTLFSNTDAEMEDLTGIKMVETTEAGFGPAGIYMKTPLSSHFPFNDYSSYSECTPELWKKAIANATLLNKIKGSFDYIYDNGEKSKMTLLHLCKSSGVWRNERRSWFGMKTCEEMDAHFQTLVSWRTLVLSDAPDSDESYYHLWGSLRSALESFFSSFNDGKWGEQGVTINVMKDLTIPNIMLPNMTMLQVS